MDAANASPTATPSLASPVSSAQLQHRCAPGSQLHTWQPRRLLSLAHSLTAAAEQTAALIESLPGSPPHSGENPKFVPGLGGSRSCPHPAFSLHPHICTPVFDGSWSLPDVTNSGHRAKRAAGSNTPLPGLATRGPSESITQVPITCAPCLLYGNVSSTGESQSPHSPAHSHRLAISKDFSGNKRATSADKARKWFRGNRTEQSFHPEESVCTKERGREGESLN